MSNINKPGISMEPIDQMIHGYHFSHILNTAVEKKVFTGLSDPKSAKEMAEEIGTDSRITEKFLNVLVTLKLLVSSDGKYFNTQEAETLLIEGNTHYIGDLIRSTVGINPLFSYLDNVLSNGGSVQELSGNNTFDEVHLLGHAQEALCSELPVILETLKDIPEFVNVKRILDLGGAHGVYSMAFARRKTVPEVTLFDLPQVIDFSGEFIKKYGMEDKIQLQAGDFINDDIGDGYDLVFASHVFYQQKAIESVLSKIYSSLNSGGVVVLNHWVINEDRTSPRLSVMFDLFISMIDRDFHVFTVNEFSDLLKGAGFLKVRVFDIQSLSSPSMLIVGWKE